MPSPSSIASGLPEIRFGSSMPTSSPPRHRRGARRLRPHPSLTGHCCGAPSRSRSAQAPWAGLISRTALLSSATSLASVLSSSTSPSRCRRPNPVSWQNAYVMSPAVMISWNNWRLRTTVDVAVDVADISVQVDFDEPGSRIKGKLWRATTWTRKISWNNWRLRTTVDVADISVDPRYSALLPELWDDVNQELELKKLVFLGPILGMGSNDLLYVMAKVDEEDSKAWVIALDMKSAAVEGLAPVSTKRYSPTTMFFPCAFPSYLNNTTQGPDMGNPVDKYFKRISASQCVLQVLLTQRWFRQLDQWLNSQGSTCFECCRLLRYCCPASALRFDIQVVIKYASYNGQGEAASKAVDFCVRALDDFDELLRESPLSDPSTTEAMQSQIGVALGALDSILQFVPLTHMPGRVQAMLADVCLKRKEQVLVFGHCDKPCHAKGRSDEEQQAGRSSPSNSVEAQKKKKKQQQQEQVLDHQSLGQSYLLYLVGCVLVAVAVKALCGHLGSV